MIDASLTVATGVLRLMPERSLFRESVATLYIADAHVGKAATFRAERFAVPVGTTGGTLQRLDDALDRTGAQRLVILGDLLHARRGRHRNTMDQLHAWRERHASLRIELVRGNHDVSAGDPEAELDIICRDAPVPDAGLLLLHRPGVAMDRYWLAGHVHPAVTLVGAARQTLLLPCFHCMPDGVVLPAFGDFTGRAEVFPAPGDRVFVVTNDEVIEIPRGYP
jgi:DNA ligase-associated metallophosphoesterase